MREPFLRSFSGSDPAAESSSTESWLNRVRENLGQLLIPSHFKASSANGAPIHLLKFDKSLRPARAQGASLITHAVVFAALLFLVAVGRDGRCPQVSMTRGRLAISHFPPRSSKRLRTRSLLADVAAVAMKT